MRNKHTACYAVTYFDSGCKGSADRPGPRPRTDLSVTENENASSAWQTL